MIIHAVDINEPISPAAIEQLLNGVSPEKREKLRRMHFEKDLIRGAVGEGLVRFLIHQQLGIAQEAIAFSYNAYGKPAIKNTPEWHFNVSHSGDWVLAALDKTEMGVDVEKRGVYDRDIARRFFAPEENHYLDTQHRADFNEGFVRIWTLKESYIKARGQGLSIPLDSFSVVDQNMQWKPVLETWGLKSFELDANHKGALCFKSLNTPLTVEKYKVMDWARGGK